jgi:hypothetical protein
MSKQEPFEAQKKICDRIAQSIYQQAGSFTILQGLNQLSILHNSAPRKQQRLRSSESEEESKGVGIWIPTSTEENPSYQRKPGINNLEASMWANRETIPAKGPKKRVVFIGESVARGFFFEPHFSPASVLETILNRHSAPVEYEVIDLARSNLSLRGLQQLIKDSLKLKPDSFVLFAGNNWIMYNDDLQKEMSQFSEALAENGDTAAFKENIKVWISGQIRNLLRFCQNIVQETGIPIFFMLPEFNDVDFASDTRYAIPYMNIEKTVEWRQSLRDASDHKDSESREQALQRMMQLDDGVSSIAPSMLARLYAEQGYTHKARQYYHIARDAELWNWLNTPRCYTFIQDMLRNEAEKHGIHLIDLPQEYQHSLKNGLPDRTLFFDYCHLTGDGIRLSMSAAAAALLQRMADQQITTTDLRAYAPTPENPVLARAHLLAANHNASWGQPESIIRHHCESAYRIDSIVFKKMNHWPEITGIPLPPIMTSAYANAWSGGDRDTLYRLATLGPYSYSHFVDTLESIENKNPSSITRIRATHHDVCKKEIDLLSPFSCIHSWAQPETLTIEDIGYFRAYSLISRFSFFCSKPADIHLTITLRIPNSEKILEPVQIRIQEKPGFEMQATTQWQTMHGTLQKENITPGLNTIELIWPLADLDNEYELHRIVQQMKQGEKIQLYQPVGDIYHFTANAQ